MMTQETYSKHIDLKLVDLFEDLKVHYKLPKTITLEKFKKLCTKYYSFVMNCILEGEVYSLPFNMGKFEVYGKKQNFAETADGDRPALKVDWNTTLKLWDEDEKMKREGKKVYFLNSHSHHYAYRLSWDKSNISLAHSSVLIFKFPVRARKILANNIFNKTIDYKHKYGRKKYFSKRQGSF